MSPQEKETAVEQVLFARRASGLSTNAAAGPPATAISFDSGHAFPGILPDLTQVAMAALSAYRAETLQYAPRPGLPELRSWIAEYMRADGVVDLSLDEVLVTNGAKHGLELVCRLLLDESDSIVVSAPTYFTAIPIFKSFGVEFIEIEQDSEGLNVPELQRALEDRKRAGKRLPKFIYDVPDFHNPTGVSMSRNRREAIIELAKDYGFFIVEDSPYRKVRFEGKSEPSLNALDVSHNTVLTLGTFSKLMAPGLRIGWIAARRDLLARIVQLKSDGGSCPLTQRLIIEFCAAGQLDDHTQRVRETYRAHRDRMVAACRREIPEANFNVPHGGYYLWLTLPPDCDGDELGKRAAAEGVILIPGSKFFAANGGRVAGQPSPQNHIRAAYSHASLDQIDEGVRRLARAYHSMNCGHTD
jgi:2-aminoadipate transaminase